MFHISAQTVPTIINGIATVTSITIGFSVALVGIIAREILMGEKNQQIKRYLVGRTLFTFPLLLLLLAFAYIFMLIGGMFLKTALQFAFIGLEFAILIVTAIFVSMEPIIKEQDEKVINSMSIKCHNCGELLEPNMDSCPKCGSKDRDIAVEDIGTGHDMVAISGSLIEGYNQLSSSFTIDQKRIADSINFAPMLEQLKRTAESNEKILELQKEAIKQAIENERRQRKLTYITTAIAVIAIIIAIIAWLFPR
ncbi:MAG: hypothetical protein ABSB71_00470 [Candidatus Bathyarchaeia archaeon]|jgi:hypothetical protein